MNVGSRPSLTENHTSGHMLAYKVHATSNINDLAKTAHRPTCGLCLVGRLAYAAASKSSEKPAPVMRSYASASVAACSGETSNAILIFFGIETLDGFLPERRHTFVSSIKSFVRPRPRQGNIVKRYRLGLRLFS